MTISTLPPDPKDNMAPYLPRIAPYRALTLWPEWAWAIHHLDKRVENRTWKIPMGVWFGLHAGKNIGGKAGDANEWDGMMSLRSMAYRAGWTVTKVGCEGGPWSFVFQHPTLPDTVAHDPSAAVDIGNPVRTSALLGAFRVTRHDAPGCGDLTGWRVPDQVGNVLEYRPFREPVPCKGAQGLWTIPEDVRAKIVFHDS